MVEGAGMFEEHIGKIVGGLVTFFATGALWLVRIIVGNQRRVAVLEKDMENRNKQRLEDRAEFKELRGDVKKILEKL